MSTEDGGRPRRTSGSAYGMEAGAASSANGVYSTGNSSAAAQAPRGGMDEAEAVILEVLAGLRDMSVMLESPKPEQARELFESQCAASGGASAR